MKTYFLILILIVCNFCGYSQAKNDYKIEYSSIDSVFIFSDSSMNVIKIFTNQTKVNNSWIKMISETCIWHFQQQEKLPLSGTNPILNLILFKTDSSSYVEQYGIPYTPNLSNYALVPSYKRLVDYTLNHFNPDYLNEFESLLSENNVASSDMIEDGFYQKLLLNIGGMYPGKPNKEVDYFFKTISTIKNINNHSKEILLYLESKYNEQLNAVIIMVDDE